MPYGAVTQINESGRSQPELLLDGEAVEVAVDVGKRRIERLCVRGDQTVEDGRAVANSAAARSAALASKDATAYFRAAATTLTRLARRC